MLIICLKQIIITAFHISIHLMLMLIPPLGGVVVFRKNFNTSHVNVNPQLSFRLLAPLPYFNTSHVNVNHYLDYILLFPSAISIHLMLMLICLITFIASNMSSISIHLMLMLILANTILRTSEYLFQYISC